MTFKDRCNHIFCLYSYAETANTNEKPFLIKLLFFWYTFRLVGIPL